MFGEKFKSIISFLIAVIICEGVGFIGSIFTTPAISTWYITLKKPTFAPPNWVFGPIWTALYLLMGISVFLVWQKGWQNRQVGIALIIFAIQLILNLLWSLFFFGLRSPILGFIDIILLWLAILFTIIFFYPLSKIAAYLLVPYFLWVSFAGVLNFYLILLNTK